LILTVKQKQRKELLIYLLHEISPGVWMTHNPGTVQNLKQHILIDPTHQVPCFVNADLDYQQAAGCTSIVKDAEQYSIMHY
jgi:hypothetical protein